MRPATPSLIPRRRSGAAAFGLAAALFFVPVAPAHAAKCESVANYGAAVSLTDIENAVKALPPEALLGKRGKPVKLPPKRVMLDNLPTVAQQGTTTAPGIPGSSEAQAFGYGLGTYTAARDSSGDIKWNANQAQNSVSAAWLYAVALKKEGRLCPLGTRSFDHLEQLARAGAPSRSQINYQPACTYLDNINTGNFPNMSRFRVGSYAVIPVGGNAAAVEQVKSQLQGGQALAFTGGVLCGYARNPAFSSGVIYDTATVPVGSHAQFIIGYDDKMGRASERGALLVQNSFGLSWPPSGSGSAAPAGQAYWSYSSFLATQAMAAVAYPVDTELGKTRLRSSKIDVPIASVDKAYQWTPGGTSKSVYLIVRLVFDAPVKLNEVWLTEPGSTPLQVRAFYGQSISSGYAYLVRNDGKTFLSGNYKLTLKAVGGTAAISTSYTGKVKVKKLKKAGDLTPGSMAGATILGPTGAAVITGNANEE